MATHQELLTKIAELQKQADDIKSSERKSILNQINDLIADHEVRVSELKFNGGTKGKGSRKPVAVKYRDSAGNTWSGRGRAPNWLTAAEKAGKKRESFLIG